MVTWFKQCRVLFSRVVDLGSNTIAINILQNGFVLRLIQAFPSGILLVDHSYKINSMRVPMRLM